MIRNAEPEDAEAIGLIRVAAWRAAYQAFMPQGFLSSLDPGNNLAELRERLSNQNANFTVFVADVKKSVVGFAIVGKPRYKANRQSVNCGRSMSCPSIGGGGSARHLLIGWLAMLIP